MSLVISKVFTYDEDAATYIQAVEAADAQALEPATRQAINNFVIGCKQDGIWSAIKASCILAGARTLAGALVPLVGTAPTNVNFVAGDYNRETGLVGDGSTKYLDSNRANNADPQNSCHQSIFATTIGVGAFIGSNSSVTVGATGFGVNETRNRCNVGTAFQAFVGLMGTSRDAAPSYVRRTGGETSRVVISSQPPGAESLPVFARSGPASYSNARLAFYSIGESLDLARLDSRVTDLINAFAVTIP